MTWPLWFIFGGMTGLWCVCLVCFSATAKGKTKTKDSYSGGSQEQTDMLENVDMSQTAHKRSAPETAGSVGGDNFQAEVINKKALSIINRVRDKLTGKDFSLGDAIDVPTQVDLLIKQATSHENLCQCYIGWCPFWWGGVCMLHWVVPILVKSGVCVCCPILYGCLWCYPFWSVGELVLHYWCKWIFGLKGWCQFLMRRDICVFGRKGYFYIISYENKYQACFNCVAISTKFIIMTIYYKNFIFF